MKAPSFAVAGLLALALTACEGADAGMRPRGNDLIPPADHAFVIFGTDTVTAELADTPAERNQGLMGRTQVPDGTGMLFVFDNESRWSFWMRDTPVDLDVAFINQLQEVVDIQQMEMNTEILHTSAAPALYALEVRRGWFADHAIELGALVQIVYGPN